MAIKQILLLFSILVHLGLLVFIFFRSRRTTTNLLFCLFLSVATLWVASIFAISFKWGISITGLIGYALAGVTGPLFILFFLRFIEVPLRPWHVFLGLPALFNFVGSLAGLVIYGPSKTIDFHPEYGPLFPFFAITTLSYVLAILFLFFRAYLSSKDPFKRAQLRFPLLAVIFISIIALGGYLVIPLLMGARGGGFGLLHIALISVPMAFTYSIVRYRYMDITVALRGFFVFLIKVILLALLITLAFLLLGLFTSPQSILYFLLIALLVSIAFFILGGVLESMVDRAIFKTHYNYRRDIRRFGTELAGLPLMGLSEITQFLSAKLNALMGVRSVELFLWEGVSFRRASQRGAASPPSLETSGSLQKEFFEFLARYEVLVREELRHAEPERYKVISAVFEELGSALLIPLRLRGSLIGFMSLGEKASGDLYTNEDIDFLTTIGGQTAVAVDNALLYYDAIETNKELLEKEEALRESEERFRLAFEDARDAIFWADANTGMLIHCNRSAEKLLEMPREAIIGMHQVQLHPPEKAEFYSRVFQTHIEAKGGTDVETEIITKSGGIVPVNISSSIVQIGKMRVYQGIFRDVTERKRMEEEQLKISKLESTGILAGGIAHDFNNLLMAILGNIELGKVASTPGGKLWSYLTNAEKWGRIAQGLTTQLITFAEGGAPITKLISITDLIEDSATFALMGSNVQCKFSIANNLWLIKVDDKQMRQVIQNMVLNAREAMPVGGRVLVRAENVALSSQEGRSLPEGDYIRVSIEDQGDGIPEENLSKIFDPYFSTKQRGNQKGMGLGLTVCHSIVKNHGGYIRVESQVKRGTTFHIYLPAFKGEAIPELNEIKRPFGGKGKVLVMDDEEMVRDLVEEMLRHLGYEVELAKEGGEGIELFKKALESGRPFDLVILDLTVRGGMGGNEAVKRLIEMSPSVKAVASSGYSRDPILLGFEQYGFKGALAKPYRMKELSQILSKIIGGVH